MDFVTGKNVRLKHFAGKYCNKGEILESVGNIITIKPEKAFTVFSYFEEDPLVLVYDEKDKFFVCQCSIVSIDYNTSNFNIIIENTEEFNNRRKDERYPTSLYGVILNSTSKETLFINNISQSGVNLKSKFRSEVNEKIEIEATIDGTYTYVCGTIQWVKVNGNFFEYGLFAEDSIPELQKMLDVIKRDHFLTVRSLKYENALINNS